MVEFIAIQQQPERENLAELNLEAAQKARASNADLAAYEYAQSGINLLGESGWINQYCLMLTLHETLADAAFLTDNFELISSLLQTVLDRSLTPLDRVKSYEILIRFHLRQKQYQQAIDRGLEILHQLDIKLAQHPNQLILLGELTKTKLALSRKSDRQLLSLSIAILPKQIAQLQILELLIAPAFFCSQKLMLVLVAKGIQLTLNQGNSAWAASFYSTYGMILASLGDLKQSYRLGEIALTLTDRFDNLAITAKVKATAPWFCRVWQQDLRSNMSIVDRSITASIDSGNLTCLGIGADIAMMMRFYAGTPLDQLVIKMQELEQLVIQSKDQSSYQLFQIYVQATIELRSIDRHPAKSIDLSPDEMSSISRWQQDGEAAILAAIYSVKTFLAYLLNDLSAALKYADAQLPYASTKTGMAIADIYDALTRLAAYPHSDKQTQKKLLNRVNTTQTQLAKRAKLMPGNFQHKYDLVTAEKCRVLGDFAQAIDLYDRAIAGAKTDEFLQEEAVANECAAKFYLAWGKEKIAAAYMQSAYDCYLRWGATAKIEQLGQLYPQLLAPILHPQQPECNPLATLTKITNSTSQDHPHLPGLNFDLASVIQSAQALSSTIDLEQLIQQLSQIILQNSGAETCILALPNPQGEWQIRWSSLAETALLTTQIPRTIANSIEYPANLIYWIKNTQQSVIFDARQPLDIADLYLIEHQPQSVFCLPILKQSQVLGVLYLEHRHTSDIFTDNSQKVISFLCNQAAIALENANLYQKSQVAAENIRLKQRDLETLLKDRQVMEIALRESEQRYHQMVSNVPGTLYQFRIAPDGSISYPYVSSGSWELLQLAPTAMMADPNCAIDLIHPEDLANFERITAESAQNITPRLWEGRAVLKSGEIKWIKCVSRPEIQVDGSIVWDGVMLDVTERKQAQLEIDLTTERLKLTVAELQQATRLKDEFLATMSHELRTPLNAILGMSEALQEEIFGTINARQLNAISTIAKSGEHLLSLINDILDVSKITAGTLELNITQVSLSALCNSSLMLVKQQALVKQIQLCAHLPTDLEPISIDERRMRQVLINLLNNAVKFTPTGGTVTLAVRIEPIEILAQTAGYAICFAVSDTGIGIASEDLTKLFQPFIQIDSSLNRKYEGTGLGLVLVKQIVELHGGDVTIDSEVGQGSCFTAIVPQTHLNLPQPIRAYLQLN